MIKIRLKDLWNQSLSSPVRDIIAAYMSEYNTSERHYNIVPSDYDTDDSVDDDYEPIMASRFHPQPSLAALPNMKESLCWLVRKANLPDFPSDVSPLSIRKWLNNVWEVLGIKRVQGFVRTSSRTEQRKRGQKPGANPAPERKTCRAQFVLIPFTEMVRQGMPLKHHPDYIRAIKLISKLEGRMHLWCDPWITAKALVIGKTGLVSVLCDQFVDELAGSWEMFSSRYSATYALLAICCSVFSERKAFTLQSQKQGALNTYMVSLLDLVKVNEPEGLKVVALFLPTQEVFSSISTEDKQMIYNTSMYWLEQFAGFLEKQWERGVAKCTRRLGRVLPRGSGVNSSGQNAVADAWMNLRRFQTVSATSGAPLILKVMQLIANDQFIMAGGVVDPNAYVYKEITSHGIRPWDAIIHPESYDVRHVLTSLLEACRKYNVPIDSWIGIAKTRYGDVSHPVNMICGCAVPPMSLECRNFLVGVGLFGSKPWKGLPLLIPSEGEDDD